MNAVVAQCAATHGVEFMQPFVVMCGGRVAGVAAHVIELADDAGIKQFACLEDRWIEAVIEAGGQDTTMLLCGIYHGLAFFQVAGQRLFAQHMLAGSECCDRHFHVQRGRGGDDHGVDVILPDQVLPVLDDTSAVFAGHRMCALPGQNHIRNEVLAIHFAECLGTQVANTTTANQSVFHCFILIPEFREPTIITMAGDRTRDVAVLRQFDALSDIAGRGRRGLCMDLYDQTPRVRATRPQGEGGTSFLQMKQPGVW